MNRTDFIAPTIIAACVLHNRCLNNQENQEIQDMFIAEGLQAVNNAGNINHETVNNDNMNAQELGKEGHALRDRRKFVSISIKVTFSWIIGLFYIQSNVTFYIYSLSFCIFNFFKNTVLVKNFIYCKKLHWKTM